MEKKKDWAGNATIPPVRVVMSNAEHGPTDAVFYGVQNQKTIILVFSSYKLMTYYDSHAELIDEI